MPLFQRIFFSQSQLPRTLSTSPKCKNTATPRRAAILAPGVSSGRGEIGHDASGRVTYDELRDVVRQTFHLPASKYPDEKIQLLWCALDTDDADSISQIEFGRFIKPALKSSKEGAPKRAEFHTK